MTKRIVSMLLSLALLLSCVSGITLFTAAADPYVWYAVDQTTGTTSGGGLTGIGVQEAALGGTTTPTAIGDTGMYGIKLGNTWGGFWFNAANKLTAADDMAMVFEYYIDADAPSGSVMVINIGGRVGMDYAEQGMVAKKVGTLVYPLTADQKSKINSNTPVYITGGDSSIYILSMKIMNLADAPVVEPEEPEEPEETLPTPLAQWDANSGTFVNNGFCPGWVARLGPILRSKRSVTPANTARN